MSRKKSAIARTIDADPKYSSTVLTKFINRMMLDGKKSTTQTIIYSTLEMLKEKTGKDELEVFLKAIDNVKPLLEVKSRRVGGSTYQVPIEVKDSRREALAMRWLINAARSRSGKSMSDRLSSELLDAFNNTGTAFKKKEDTHRMAEANRAFSHYRW